MTATSALVSIDALTITENAGNPILDDAHLTLFRGEWVGIIGPSGSGKTTLALSLLGEIRPGLYHRGGTVTVNGLSPLEMRPRQRREFRRSQTAWLSQDPTAALTPTMQISTLLSELLPRSQRTRERITDALTSVGLPTDRDFLSRLPHQISGGQRRRVALARALIRDPELLILDEPLAGLDRGNRRTVLTVLHAIRARQNLTGVVVSHDIEAMRDLVDHLIVMDSGQILEAGPASEVLALPSSETARQLIHALEPAPVQKLAPNATRAAVVSAHELGVAIPGREPVVQDANFTVASGEGIAIIGASGAGKTTLARTLIGLVPPLSGEVVRHRGASDMPGPIGYVPQDPATTLNPAHTIEMILRRAIRQALTPSGDTVETLLAKVGLDSTLAKRRPSGLSGGQRQRVAVARSLATGPDLLVCDEPTSALDPVVATGLLDLLNQLRHDGLAVIVISHELHNIGRVATRVLELDDCVLTELDSERFDHANTHPERSITV